jgi:hypothetical protein
MGSGSSFFIRSRLASGGARAIAIEEMRMPDERPEKRTSPGEKVAKGSLHGVN